MGNFESFYGKTVGSSAGSLSGVGRFTKLWENSAPTSAFAAQNITLNSSDYDFLLIICDRYAAMGSEFSTVVQKGYSAYLDYTRYDNGASIRAREFTRTSDTVYAVSDALQNGNVANSHVIPLAIYGIKLL